MHILLKPKVTMSGLLAVLLCTLCIVGIANSSTLEAVIAWDAVYSGPAGSPTTSDRPSDIAVDSNDNVLVTGGSVGINGNYDYATIKYENDGTLLWIARYNGPGNNTDESAALVIDSAGNVYVTGKSTGASTGLDYTTIKYDANGNELWVARYNGPGDGDDEALALAVDANGNVYVTGKSLGSNANLDYATVKYDADGNQLWVVRYDGPAGDSDEAADVVVDISGNVYVTGKSVGSTSGMDFATIKYDGAGTLIWVSRYNGLLSLDDKAVSVAVDSSSNVYVAGTVKNIDNGWGQGDYGVIKYDSDGNQLWLSIYHDSFGKGREELNDMEIDANGNVYVTGKSWRYRYAYDYCTIKYDTNGNKIWHAFYTGLGEDDTGVDLTLDYNLNVIVTGKSFSGGNEHCSTVKYDSNGSLIWKTRYREIYYSRGAGVAVDSQNNVFITAEAINNTNWDYVTIKYVEGPVNTIPVANAGIDQTVHVGSQVVLDGTGSYDPDNDYPLSYAWAITAKPSGSTAILENPDTSSPTFFTDAMGDYTIELVTSDSKGAFSAADTVTVSTINSAPVADAGPDLSIILVGSQVNLDGTMSWDDDGDPITYAWSIVEKPAESLAVLSDPSSNSPTFVADVHGQYTINLIVSDPWVSSPIDQIVISFDNLVPIADAGVNQSVIQGDTVYLDGGGSNDANLDPLTFNWSIANMPAGSTAGISAPYSVTTIFMADLPGEYIISLVVNDGYVDSIASNVTIIALSSSDATTEALSDAIVAVNNIDLSMLKNPKMTNALTNKINAALAKIDQGLYAEALDQLSNDVIKKTNGCAEIGSPDNNDWILDCAAQNSVYTELINAINLLQELI